MQGYTWSAELEYIGQCIGSKVLETLKAFNVPVIAHGGIKENSSQALGFQPENVHILSSLYSRWGIEKAFVSGSEFPDGKPRFMMILPRSEQYIVHYVKMFQAAGVQGALVNVACIKSDKTIWGESSSQLIRQILTVKSL